MAEANQREETGCDRGRDMREPAEDIVPVLAVARRVESLRRAVEEIIVMLMLIYVD
jgi:hypothetical protein